MIKRRKFKSLLLKSFIVILIMILLKSYFLYQISETEVHDISIDLSNNYFQSSDKMRNKDFLVDTKTCRIPELDIWDVGIQRLVKAPANPNCAEKSVKLTYVEKNTVAIDEEVLKSMGYTLEEISCCYRTIERIEQTRDSYDKNADNSFRLSQECIQMDKITKPKSSFIKVTCNPSATLYQGAFHTLYKNFHLVAMFPENDDTSNISRKLSYWENCLSTDNGETNFESDKICAKFRKDGRPPNVLVLGWDSTSRGNFHRFMPESKHILENIIGAVEMVGFNKVGENTFPNFVPLMTSFSAEELEKYFYPNSSTLPYDDCPWIWKEFSEQNYLTGLMEDAPAIAIFSFLRPGFIKPPVDIYLRPFMLAAYTYYEYFIDSIGYQRPEEVVLNYIVDMAELAESRNIPYFLTTWFTDLTHHDMNNLQIADDLLASTLERLNGKGLLENTLLLLVSDHGYRFLEVRTTTPGWFEDKLPALWIKPPSSLSKEQEESWLDALKYNSRILTTPFDIYEAFRQILTTYWPPTPKPEMEVAASITDKTSNLRGLNPFKKIPDRTCEEAGIPPTFCACTSLTACNYDSTFIKSAALSAIQDINLQIPPQCKPLKVATIIACGMIESNYLIKNGNNYRSHDMDTDDLIVIVVGSYTRPGNFLLEAMVKYVKTSGEILGISLLRINKKICSSKCLSIERSEMDI